MKKKALFVIPTMSGGGAERVFLNLLRHLDREKFIPVLALFRKVGEYLDQVPGEVAIYDLEKYGKGRLTSPKFFSIASRLSDLMKEEHPDVVLSFMWYPNSVTLQARKWSRGKFPVIVSERYSLVGSGEGVLTEWVRRFLIGKYYDESERIVVNSAEMKQQFISRFDVPERKISVIYNPVDIQGINEQARIEAEDADTEGIPVVVGMGRLEKQKGFEHLIRAISIVNSRSCPCRCRILGEGPEKENLIREARKAGVENRLELLGFRKNPYPYIARADIFVLSSLYEGFPNAVLEAMSLRVPVIAARCPTGPEEIIESGHNGILVGPGDETGMADAIVGLLEDASKRNRIGLAGYERAQGFSVGTITRQYEAAMLDAISS